MTKMEFNKRKQPLIIKNLVEHFVEKKNMTVDFSQ